ncbi:MAG: metalloregulator ArsR/SmtB family transcription factor [Acholeplasmatales bacterium]|jgi:ArsR family transcriptional regulator|nr:metalloregulator ArsR/SmtB family transcription factor [Acholeplasmataceae bacterium]MDY0115182.1 metalloregulator ArsR/SmtB family transcription factor [Acholeplasmatales bacterium]MCK9233655.1 metalloregulator ArsR/SmtB family transcription factor [Acholeplasmataceae bacterium]MCK9288956.1 metalloregulator ArsR/SmtB family transcription factor [Acholeplasmataceae bacterium]MCK9427550.1 metalloregulator ArsR/SmtB family transcription factor [Acholeplasmataceae bacterium]
MLLEFKIKEKLTSIFKGLADSTRLDILTLLSQKERSVSEIVALLTISQSAVSHQLKTLKEAALVKGIRKGKYVIYSLNDDHVYQIFTQAVEHAKEMINEEKNV